jgi:hypothetical protein
MYQLVSIQNYSVTEVHYVSGIVGGSGEARPEEEDFGEEPRLLPQAAGGREGHGREQEEGPPGGRGGPGVGCGDL